MAANRSAARAMGSSSQSTVGTRTSIRCSRHRSIRVSTRSGEVPAGTSTRSDAGTRYSPAAQGSMSAAIIVTEASRS